MTLSGRSQVAHYKENIAICRSIQKKSQSTNASGKDNQITKEVDESIERYLGSERTWHNALKNINI